MEYVFVPPKQVPPTDYQVGGWGVCGGRREGGGWGWHMQRVQVQMAARGPHPHSSLDHSPQGAGAAAGVEGRREPLPLCVLACT